MVKKTNNIPEGLNQKFIGRDKKHHKLKDVLSDGDWWETTGKEKTVLLKHDAVKKIAKIAGYKVTKYEVVIQPTIYNNMTISVLPTVLDSNGELVQPEMGEASRDNLGSNGKRFPLSIAQKRAFDRTVLSGLGISGVLSEDQLPDEDKEKSKMDNLTHEEKKTIAPLITQLMLAKKKTEFAYFSKNMPENKTKLALNEEQVTYIKKLYQKRLAEIQKVNF